MESKHSIFQNHAYWYIVAQSKALKMQPIRVMLFSKPLVLFRDDQGEVHGLLDRCPHRNVPLSEGKVEGSHIQCPYHGWEFDGKGVCKHIPAMENFSERESRNVTSYKVKEQQGYIWVYGDPKGEPKEPLNLPK